MAWRLLPDTRGRGAQLICQVTRPPERASADFGLKVLG